MSISANWRLIELTSFALFKIGSWAARISFNKAAFRRDSRYWRNTALANQIPIIVAHTAKRIVLLTKGRTSPMEINGPINHTNIIRPVIPNITHKEREPRK